MYQDIANLQQESLVYQLLLCPAVLEVLSYLKPIPSHCSKGFTVNVQANENLKFTQDSFRTKQVDTVEFKFVECEISLDGNCLLVAAMGGAQVDSHDAISFFKKCVSYFSF